MGESVPGSGLARETAGRFRLGPVGWAIVAGVALRFVWAVVATSAPGNHLTDGAQFLRLAGDFSHGRQMSLGGHPTAWFAYGYPLFLVPVAWLARAGVVSMAFGASLANVALGGVTIAGVARLGREWFGPRAAVVAAWLMALYPEHVMFSAAALSETLAACLVVWACALASQRWGSAPFAVDRHRRAATVGFVLVVLAAVVVRANLALLALAPVLAVWPSRRRRDIRRSVAATAAMAVAALALMAGVGVYNQRRTGAFSLGFTGVASAVCSSNVDGVNGLGIDEARALVTCHRNSPFDNTALYEADTDLSTVRPGQIPFDDIRRVPADEGQWYRSTMRRSLSWAVHHPGREAWMTTNKLIQVVVPSDAGVDASMDQGQRDLVPFRVQVLLQMLSNLAGWAVTLAAIVGLMTSSALRRAVVVWGTALVLIVSGLPAVFVDRYHVLWTPLVLVLAAPVLAPLSRLRATS